MKKISLFITLFLLQSCIIGAGTNSRIEANKNSYFPKITGIDLNGQEQEIPTVFKNKFNLVILAFKREQQAEVDTWIKAIEPIIKENPNLNLYEIPLIYQLSAFGRMWVNNGMRFGISDKAARKRTITVYTDREEFFRITRMQEDKIYALLIDDGGKILWRAEGIANIANLTAVKNIILAR